jgi:hypothetical protein
MGLITIRIQSVVKGLVLRGIGIIGLYLAFALWYVPEAVLPVGIGVLAGSIVIKVIDRDGKIPRPNRQDD